MGKKGPAVYLEPHASWFCPKIALSETSEINLDIFWAFSFSRDRESPKEEIVKNQSNLILRF